VSYDFVLWRVPAESATGETFRMLASGETVEGLKPFTAAEVVDAFSEVFGADVTVSPKQRILGPSFETLVSDGDRYVQIGCSWKVAQSPERESLEGKLGRVARKLGASLFNPQDVAPVKSASPKPPGKLSANEITTIDDLLVGLGTPKRERYSRADEDRAQSFACVDRWRVSGLDWEGTGLHAMFVRDAGHRKSVQDQFHPTRLTGLVCDYARLVQSVLPVEMIAANGGGQAKDGVGYTFPARVIGIINGQVGFVTSPHSTLLREDDVVMNKWTDVILAPPNSGPRDSGSPAVLTEAFDAAARSAFAAARAGDTRRLRDWIVLMCAVSTNGLAAEELLPGEVPPGDSGAPAFQLLEDGAVMPVWSCRDSASFRVQAELDLSGRRGFVLKIIPRDRSSPRRHDLGPPLGRPRQS
jgi:hypothetical protein